MEQIKLEYCIPDGSEELVNFPFYKLSELEPFDYDKIRQAAEWLQKFVRLEKFYTDFNNCMDQTLDFILNYARALALRNNPDELREALMLLEVLKVIIQRVANDDNLCLNQERIVEFLVYAITQAKTKMVQLEIGVISVEMVIAYRVGAEKRISRNMTKLLVECCKLFHYNGELFLLTRITRIILERKLFSFNRAQYYLKWIEKNAVDTLTRCDSDLLFLETCYCIVLYYKTYAGNDSIGHINFLDCLNELIAYRATSSNNLRFMIDSIFVIIVEQYYLNDSYRWPGGTDALLETIRNLPVDYKTWPYHDKEFFFVFAYIQLDNVRSNWCGETILKEIELYLRRPTLPPKYVLKGLLSLYLNLLDRAGLATSYRARDILVTSVMSVKCISRVVTLDSIQLNWFLNDPNPSIQNRILVHLLSKKTDEDIISALQKSKWQLLLMPLFNIGLDELQRDRLLHILGRLLEEKNSLGQFIPLKIDVAGYLIQNSLKKNIQQVGTQMLKLCYMSRIPELVAYNLALFEHVKDKPSAFFLFCEKATIRTLCSYCTNEDQRVSIAAIKMMHSLIKIQVQYEAVLSYAVTMNFIKLLKTVQSVTEQVLIILKQVLMRKRELIVSYDKSSVVGLFHLIIDMALNKLWTRPCVEILKMLLRLEPKLIHMQVLPSFLNNAYDAVLGSGSEAPFLTILILWLRNTNTCSNLRIRLIQHIFTNFPKKCKKHFATIKQIFMKRSVEVNTTLLTGTKFGSEMDITCLNVIRD
ncbi:hypothetical protein PPYR_09041 [Photinus pyralis]|uniref:Uncharacterized protein n=1 Tax=Photinus pyralis TaxID=7054 RepID=A0A5N4ALF1_PHOPY|nr:uncharacterized protein LOC116170100 isoform X2 [Photinus pyralis]KAB0798048.1 hypothetical protein PPYR_09041 [Photinus pyralis]